MTKEDVVRDLEKIDKEIIRLHTNRYRCKRAFVGTSQSELLKLKRSFLFVRLYELDDDNDNDEWGELRK